MTVGAGVGVGYRLEVDHVLPEIGRLDARQELLRRVVRARIALMRRRGGRGRSESAEEYEAEQDEPRLLRSRARTLWHGTLPPEERIAGSGAAVRRPAAPAAGTSGDHPKSKQTSRHLAPAR